MLPYRTESPPEPEPRPPWHRVILLKFKISFVWAMIIFGLPTSYWEHLPFCSIDRPFWSRVLLVWICSEMTAIWYGVYRRNRHPVVFVTPVPDPNDTPIAFEVKTQDPPPDAPRIHRLRRR